MLYCVVCGGRKIIVIVVRGGPTECRSLARLASTRYSSSRVSCYNEYPGGSPSPGVGGLGKPCCLVLCGVGLSIKVDEFTPDMEDSGEACSSIF